MRERQVPDVAAALVCSAKHRRHGVNVQVVTDPVGEVLWISPALPGRTHDTCRGDDPPARA